MGIFETGPSLTRFQKMINLASNLKRKLKIMYYGWLQINLKAVWLWSSNLLSVTVLGKKRRKW